MGRRSQPSTLALRQRSTRAAISVDAQERQAEAFIVRRAKPANRKPTMIRIPSALLERIDRGAERLGISRSAFIVQSAAEKLERMERSSVA